MHVALSSRRRSSSLGSCEDDRGELMSVQISKKIHTLKKKIRKYEEKFEEERKYRVSRTQSQQVDMSPERVGQG